MSPQVAARMVTELATSKEGFQDQVIQVARTHYRVASTVSENSVRRHDPNQNFALGIVSNIHCDGDKVLFFTLGIDTKTIGSKMPSTSACRMCVHAMVCVHGNHGIVMGSGKRDQLIRLK